MSYQKRHLLVFIHVMLIGLSNTLVQYPFHVLGYKTTWGALSYPFIFVVTDLTTRLLGASKARKVIFGAMLPALLASYIISNCYQQGTFLVVNWLSLRIALASVSAYTLGQLLDIYIFQALKNQLKWWFAPLLATFFANIFDTYFFFFVAFFHNTETILSQHWIEIATVDLGFKLLLSILTVIPLYGVILGLILRTPSPITPNYRMG